LQPRLPFESETLPTSDTPPPTCHTSPPTSQTSPLTALTVSFVRHPRARRYRIRVRLDGSVRVTIPRRGSKRDAAAFLQEQREWVVTQQRRASDERHRMPPDLPPDEEAALVAQARQELPDRLKALAEPLGLTVRRITIRSQRHRWGSCSPSGHISLNWRLVTMPPWVRDYVLYHELMHLKRMDHSPRFWRLVEEVCPRYREARAWLRRYALAPHAAVEHGAPA
jgi:predicted metal-dependent hydrolase